MDGELRSMVMGFRVAELQTLLGFAGKNKSGRKNELQARCLDLVKSKSPPIAMKIKELYRTIQISSLGHPLTSANSYFGTSSDNSYGTTNSLSNINIKPGFASSDKIYQDNSYGRTYNLCQQNRSVTVDGQYRTIPICPDVTMKKLPFYDIMSTLLRPTSLLMQGQMPKQEFQHSFCLTPSQAKDIANSRDYILTHGDVNPTSRMHYTVQVQLRFCAIETSEEQDDLFPPSLSVKLNGRPIQLPHPIPSNRPGVDPKRPSRPLNITSNIKCCPHTSNIIHVQWIADNTKSYAMSVQVVKRLTAEELLQRLKNKRIQPADYTRGRIKELTTAEEEDLCAPTSIGVSVACPLGKNRMTYPCRATTCKHLQCFDANAFLLMNEKKPSFICPVCNKQLKFDELSIDGYFMDVIQNLSITAGNDIELHADGSWVPAVKIKAEIDDIGPAPKRLKQDAKASLDDTVILDDDICIIQDVPSNTTSSGSGRTEKRAFEPEVVDLLDSSDEEEDQESTPNIPTPSPSSSSITAKTVDEMDKRTNGDDEDDDDDEEEIGVRPRRRKARVNYVEDSSSDSISTNEGDAVTQSKNPHRSRSPACIELSDSSHSPQSVQQPSNYDNNPKRSFSSVSSSQSLRSAPQLGNRAGSGASATLYSTPSSVMPTNAPGMMGGSLTHHHHFNTPSSSPYIRSPHLAPSTQPPGTVLNSQSSFLYPQAMSSSSSGYTAYDASSSWGADLNSFINPPGFDLTYDFLNPQGYDPRSGGGPGTYGNWM